MHFLPVTEICVSLDWSLFLLHTHALLLPVLFSPPSSFSSLSWEILREKQLKGKQRLKMKQDKKTRKVHQMSSGFGVTSLPSLFQPMTLIPTSLRKMSQKWTAMGSGRPLSYQLSTPTNCLPTCFHRFALHAAVWSHSYCLWLWSHLLLPSHEQHWCNAPNSPTSPIFHSAGSFSQHIRLS